MSRKPRNGNGKPGIERPGALRPEDAALWEKVIRSAEPLGRGRNRAPLRDTGAERPEHPERGKKSASGEKAGKTAPAQSRTSSAPQPPVSPPPLGAYDRREAKGLGSGRIGIDARIDLHGMRQREAHAALKTFIARARERGHRHILVITGKGTVRDSESGDSPRRAGEPGILRRAVPLWLAEPDLRQWVVGYTVAAPRHGGEGALYVRLRRADRSG